MSDNLQQYIQSLETQVNTLKDKIKFFEDSIVDIKVQFDLKKSDIVDQVEEKLSSYNPDGLGVADKMEVEDLSIKDRDISSALREIYKLD